MPKIINAFRGPDPIAQVIANIGKSHGNTLADQYRAAQLYQLQMETAERQALAQDMLKFGTPDYDPGMIAARAALSGDTDYANRHRFTTAVTDDQYDPISRAMLGAGQAMSSTPHGFGADQARQTGEFNARESRLGREFEMDQHRRAREADRTYDRGVFESDRAHGRDALESDRTYNRGVFESDRAYGRDALESDRTYNRGVFESDRAFDEGRRQYNMTPETIIGDNGLPMIVPRDQSYGQRAPISETNQIGTLIGTHFDDLPSLNPQQQEVLGAHVDGSGTNKASTPRNYFVGDQKFITYDGVTDAQTGLPLPPGGQLVSTQLQGGRGDIGLTPAVTTDVQSDIISADRFIGIADRMIELTHTDPSLFGLPGAVRGGAQELAQAVNAIGGLFGGDVDRMADAARRDLAANGLANLLPQLYDPNLPKVEMLGYLALYAGASTLAGQENRSVSDKDIQLMMRILGNPQGIFSSAQSVRTKMTLAKEITLEHRRLAQQYLSQGVRPEDMAKLDLGTAALANVMGRREEAPAQNAPAEPSAQGAADFIRRADEIFATGDNAAYRDFLGTLTANQIRQLQRSRGAQ